MKCDRENLWSPTYAGITTWNYVDHRPNGCREHDVLSRNWWQPVADMIRAGDMIFVSGKEWGCILFVNTNTFNTPIYSQSERKIDLEHAAVTVLPMGRTPL